MATLHREIDIACDPDQAWTELADFGSAGRLFAGVLSGCEAAAGERTVTFANGHVAKERLVTVDAPRRRLVYTVLGDLFEQHSAAMQLLPAPGGVRFIWTSDFLPDEAAERVAPLVEAGCQAIKRNLEAAET